MRLPQVFSILAALASALLAGCSGSGPADAAAADPAPEAEAQEPARTATDLGRLEMGPAPAGSYSFDVTVPEGNATRVSAILVSEPYAAGRIEGEGCPSEAATVSISVGTSNTQEWACEDLAAGTYTFRVVVDTVSPGFQASVRGAVLQA